MKRLTIILLALLALAGVAQAVNLCSITGTVYKPDGSTCNRCLITFTPTGTVPQIVGGNPIYPTAVYSTTNASGVMNPTSLIQSSAMTVMITDTKGYTSAPVQTSVAAGTGESIAQLLANNQLTFPITTVSSLGVGTKNVVFADSPYAVGGGDFFITCDASGGNVVINLPASAGTGRWLHVKKTDASANTCTVNRIGGDTIDGAASYTLDYQYAGAYFTDNSLGAWVVSGPTRELGTVNATTINSGDITSSSVGGPHDLVGYKAAGTIDPRGYGAKLDAAACNDITATNSGPGGEIQITSAGCADFTGRAGELIKLYTVNGPTLVDTVIDTIASTHVANLVSTATAPGGGIGEIVCNDDGALTNTYINGQPINSTFTIQLPSGRMMCTGSPINFNARNVNLRGAGGAFGGGRGTGSLQTGSMIIPIFAALPAIPAVVYMPDASGAEVSHMMIAGDQLYGRNLDVVMTARDTTLTGFGWTSSGNRFDDLQLGEISGTSFENQTAPTNPAALHALDFGGRGSNGNNDKMNVGTILAQGTVFGISMCGGMSQSVANPCQAGQMDVNRVQCNRVGVCIDAMKGGGTGVVHQLEMLGCCQVASIGQAMQLTIDQIATQLDTSRQAFAIPWTATTTLPRNMTLWGTDGSLHLVTTSGTTSGSEPTWSVSCPNVGDICVDNTMTTTTLTTGQPPTMLATFLGTGGNTGGTLNMTGGLFALNGWSPPYGNPIGALISGDGGTWAFAGDRMNFTNDTANPPVGGKPPVFDLSVIGTKNPDFACRNCRGLSSAYMYSAVASGDTRQITHINLVRQSSGASDTGDVMNEYLVNNAQPQTFRTDLPGKANVNGGPFMVKQLPAPAGLFSVTCSGSGANTYLYKATAMSSTGETIGSAEATRNSCCTVGAGGCTIQGAVFPVVGAEQYNIYRTAAGGGSGTEKLANFIVANQVAVTSLGTNSWLDGTTDGTLGAAIPTANTTGTGEFQGSLTTDKTLFAASIELANPPISLGGGATPTLGTIGGSGPTSAAQAGWVEQFDNTGTPYWFAIWR